MKRTLSAAAVGLFVLISGCVAQTPSDGSSSPKGVDADDDFGVDADSGAVMGSVLTEDGLPVPNVQVGLQGLDLRARTDETGGFVLPAVAPGTYELLAAAIGYDIAARTVEVVAGDVVEVTLTAIAAAPVGHAHVEILQHVGFFECALATEAWISACSYPYTAVYGSARDNGVDLGTVGAPSDVQKNTHRFNITINPGVGQLVVELTWQAASAASQRMLIQVLCGDYDPFWDECYDGIRYGQPNGFTGENPVRAVIEGADFVSKGNGTEKWDLNKGPIWVMNYIGLPFGDPQLAFQQKFEVWDSVFYNSVAPEGYTVIDDA